MLGRFGAKTACKNDPNIAGNFGASPLGTWKPRCLEVLEAQLASRNTPNTSRGDVGAGTLASLEVPVEIVRLWKSKPYRSNKLPFGKLKCVTPKVLAKKLITNKSVFGYVL